MCVWFFSLVLGLFVAMIGKDCWDTPPLIGPLTLLAMQVTPMTTRTCFSQRLIIRMCASFALVSKFLSSPISHIPHLRSTLPHPQDVAQFQHSIFTLSSFSQPSSLSLQYRATPPVLLASRPLSHHHPQYHPHYPHYHRLLTSL